MLTFHHCFGRRLLLALTAVFLAGSTALADPGELLSSDRTVEEAIDHYIGARLKAEKVTPAPDATPATLLRRTTLDLAGRIATGQEVRSYLAATAPQRRTEWVDRLLNSPEFVRHQSDQLNTLLMGDTNKDLRGYLRTALAENRPWDRMFQDMLLGADPMAAEQNATQFVLARVSDLDKLTNQTSVAFFGVNVSCAKCHDHPEVGDWTQARFYGMKSFFNRTFENGGFLGERDYGLVKYKTTSGEERDARLMFFSGTELEEPEHKPPTGDEQKAEKKKLDELKKNKQPPPPPKFSRRAKLVETALLPEERDYFARAIVNKMWNQLLGRGLVMPIDQMHPENPPSHPALLAWLTRDLIEHDYDLKRLIRGIVLSQAYARSSRWAGAESPPPADLFAVGKVRPLSPQQYAFSLRLASTSPDRFGEDVAADEQAKRLEAIYNSARGLANKLEQPGEDFQVSVTEALMFNNNEQIRNDLLRDSGDTLMGKLKGLEQDREVVETALWSVYSRPPEESEIEPLVRFLADGKAERDEAIRHLVWALLTSSPCRFNY